MKLKVLMSAYACEPGRGSEPEVGWQWALHMSRAHDVSVVTRANNRQAIEAGLAQSSDPHPRFIYYDLPPFWVSLKKKGLPVSLYYFLWQIGVRIALRKRLREFDLIHHITFNSFRQPGCWWGCGKPVILGPLGGGQVAPWRMLSLFSHTKWYEVFRSITVLLASYVPSVLLSCLYANVILVANGDTERRIPALWRKKCHRLLETGVSPAELSSRAPLDEKEEIRVIWVSRFDEIKAPLLAVRAFAGAFQRNARMRLTMVGDGPDFEAVRQTILLLGLSSAVTLLGKVPKGQIAEVLASHDMFLFTSLRDTSGNVLLEAMAAGLPSVCLRHHGAAEISTDQTAIRVVPSSVETTLQKLAEALLELASSAERRVKMGRAARERVEQHYLWPHKAEMMNAFYSNAARAICGAQIGQPSRQGLWVVLIGPDGVGKTSVANGLFPKVADRFESLRYHHWIAPWTRPLLSEIPPGGGRFTPGPCRGGFLGNLLSLARLARNVIRAWLGYLLRILPHLHRRRLVLGDRYLFNYLLDSQSVRYGASPFWVRLALRLVPKPGVVISLVADPEAIHARKDELTVAEIADRLARARELRELGFNLVEISAAAPLPAVIDSVAATVISLAPPCNL
jgi:glycosyltransferase involved in cell wall biosynthesis